MKLKTFRIEEDATAVSEQQRTLSPQADLEKLTKDMRKENKFLYIDINTESGFRVMKECESSDEEEEMDTIGRNYRVNLNDLYTTNSKAINYLYKMKESTKKKEKAMKLVNQELKMSTEKILQIERRPLNSTRYLLKPREQSYRSSQSKVSSITYSTPKDNKLFSVLSKSFNKQADSDKNYSTLGTERYSQRSKSPLKKAQKYFERIKLVLPGIKVHRKPIVI